MLTLEQLKQMPEGTVFATGVVENSPDGIYMTNNDVGRKLVWVAKRGGIEDWAIYIHWANNGVEYATHQGDKVMNKNNIQKLVPCTPEAFKMYRF